MLLQRRSLLDSLYTKCHQSTGTVTLNIEPFSIIIIIFYFMFSRYSIELQNIRDIPTSIVGPKDSHSVPRQARCTNQLRIIILTIYDIGP